MDTRRLYEEAAGGDKTASGLLMKEMRRRGVVSVGSVGVRERIHGDITVYVSEAVPDECAWIIGGKPFMNRASYVLLSGCPWGA